MLVLWPRHQRAGWPGCTPYRWRSPQPTLAKIVAANRHGESEPDDESQQCQGRGDSKAKIMSLFCPGLQSLAKNVAGHRGKRGSAERQLCVLQFCLRSAGAEKIASAASLRCQSNPVSMEVLVEKNVVSPIRIFLKLLRPAVDGRFPSLSRRKMADSLRASSFATLNRFMYCPEPVGHSTRKSSP